MDHPECQVSQMDHPGVSDMGRPTRGVRSHQAIQYLQSQGTFVMLFMDTTPKLAGHQVQLHLVQEFLLSVIREWRQDREGHGIVGWKFGA